MWTLAPCHTTFPPQNRGIQKGKFLVRDMLVSYKVELIFFSFLTNIHAFYSMPNDEANDSKPKNVLPGA